MDAEQWERAGGRPLPPRLLDAFLSSNMNLSSQQWKTDRWHKSMFGSFSITIREADSGLRLEFQSKV